MIRLIKQIGFFAPRPQLSFISIAICLLLIPVLALLAAGCQASASPLPSPGIQQITKTTPAAITSSEAITESAVENTKTAPPTLTALPVIDRKPTAALKATATMSPSAVPLSECVLRVFNDDLLTIVTREYGLSRDYEPNDLVSVTEYLPLRVTMGYETEVREVIIEPLVDLISDMIAEGLDPKVISGYRSYSAQAIAWEKWRQQEPERVSIISAPPGYSEHQLGTTIDFGSPELEDIVGQEGIEFHTYFYQTREGVWLAENAHKYGFSMSYPREAQEITGFFYEPWHFRYVGVELATYLKEEGTFLTDFLLEHLPEPCIP